MARIGPATARTAPRCTKPNNPYMRGHPHYRPVSEGGAGATPWGIPRRGTMPVARWAVLVYVRPRCAIA
jgi:hypothetical protein